MMSTTTAEEIIAVRFIGWVAFGVYLFGAFLVTHAAGATPERKAAIGTAVAIMAIGYPLGRVVGWFLARDSDVDETGFQVVAWANLLCWLVPVIGATISAMTWRFARQSGEHGVRYACLGALGAWSTIGFAVYGGWHATPAIPAPVAVSAEAPAVGGNYVTSSEPITIPYGPHTRERCPYSLLEHWPASDVEAAGLALW